MEISQCYSGRAKDQQQLHKQSIGVMHVEKNIRGKSTKGVGETETS